MTGITVIIPTIGRESAALTASSVTKQAIPFGDAVWLCPDRKSEGAFGHPVRNHNIDAEVEGRYLWSIDDDDIALPGALVAMHEAIEAHPGRWFLFRMIGGANSHYPRMTVPVQGMEGVMRPGNIGTPMILFPKCKARFGTGLTGLFGEDKRDGYFGDWTMAQSLQNELGDPIWIDQVVAEIRP